MLTSSEGRGEGSAQAAGSAALLHGCMLQKHVLLKYLCTVPLCTACRLGEKQHVLCTSCSDRYPAASFGLSITLYSMDLPK